ncbi:Phospholipase D [Zhongshania aliphaticivorans]|uniref:Phospholipase D n=1 Tax=Zhongshania aliphaticivorans TaxID=1470434 RepID=A0A5S9MZW5_9GAMM|nr:alkaline phosphatase D family protein [Zhongshania aliphaticivorans]CAA0082995.1 Phospholipase D [Zhongshania aliphaticivorans]CAA0083808.1 Phospholipase D [Zhongshania aliphaticivorans]
MKRRHFLRAMTTASIAVPILTACGGSSNSNSPSSSPGSSGSDIDVSFLHGVASGDPLDDRVILWTRVTPAEDVSTAIDVLCEVAEDPEFDSIVLSEIFSTSAERDYTVKFDAAGLLSEQHYWYRFSVGEQQSPVGRALTLPMPGQYAERLRYAVCSCSSYPHGFFSVYRMIANRTDLDFVLHLGDYIYEYGDGEYGDNAQRLLDPSHEIVALDDYRRRYSLYRKDVDLQAAHQIHPFITVWDDHETADNSYKDGAGNHNEGEGDWLERKAYGIQAYFEWMPIRPPTESEDSIYRAFRYGDLADFMMLDTRLEGRVKQLDNPVDPARSDARDLLGQTQKEWFKNKLATAQGQWKFVGQQVMFAQLQLLEIQRLLPGVPTNDFSPLVAINMDQWDGYPVEREEILDFVEENAINNLVVLTGDIHTSWANEIYKSSAVLTSGIFDEPLGVEFVTPSVTSPGFPDGAAELVSAVLPVVNPHMKYTDLKNHGFVLMDVTHQRAQAEFYYAENIDSADQSGVESSKVKTLSVNSGSSRLVEDTPLSYPKV